MERDAVIVIDTADAERRRKAGIARMYQLLDRTTGEVIAEHGVSELARQSRRGWEMSNDDALGALERIAVAQGYRIADEDEA